MEQRYHDLAHEKEVLTVAIDAAIKDFDDKVRTLLKAKRDTEVKIKYAEHSHIMYYRELVHLKVFDIREEEIEARRDAKALELSTAKETGQSKQITLQEKKGLIKKYSEDEKVVQKEFQITLGEGNRFEKFLTKVFKKKIKKKKVKPEGEESDSDSDSDSDDESDYDSDESDDEDFDDTVPVAGCSQELFDKVIVLRDQRLEAEWGLADEKQISDLLKKECDMLAKKDRTIKDALNVVERELSDFQLEKQAKLNDLDTGVPLRLGQIHFCTTKGIPDNLDEALIFDVRNIEKLKRTITNLTKEKSDQRSAYKEIKTQQRRLEREKREKQAANDELDRKCNELQMLKFGALIELESLETSDINPQGVELRSKLRSMEKKASSTVKAEDERIFGLKAELASMVMTNTAQFREKLDLTLDKRALEGALKQGRKEMITDDSVMLKKERMERRRLKELAGLQEQEIASLRAEIEKLGRKGGHVLPPTKPMPQPARRHDALPSITA